MNRKLLLLIGASFLIASCGGSSNSNKQAAIDACSMDGGPMNKEVCTCFINSLEDTLNSDSFDISANLKNGILEIKIPRKAEVKTKAIKIAIK